MDYEEQHLERAIALIKRRIRKDPKVLDRIMQGCQKEHVYHVLKTQQEHLEWMQVQAQAWIAAAKVLADFEKKRDATTQSDPKA